MDIIDIALAKKYATQNVSELSSRVDSLQAAVGTPLVAETAAEMTDTSKIYVYVGTESGYNQGHWYYSNGTAWQDGGVYNSIAFQTDTTLTVSGAAADAKAAGDAVDDLKSALRKNGYGIISFKVYANFVNGRLNNGVLDTSKLFRVATNDIISFPTDMTIYIASGYRMSAAIYENGSYSSTLAWKTGSYVMPANTYFKLQIGASPEDTSVTLSVNDALEAVYMIDHVSEKADENEDKLDDLLTLDTTNVVSGTYYRADTGNIGKSGTSDSYSYVVLPVTPKCVFSYSSGSNETQAGCVFFSSSNFNQLSALSGTVGQSDYATVTAPNNAIYGVFSYRNDKISASNVVKICGSLSAVMESTSSVLDASTPFATIDMFSTIACLGDSFTRGGMYLSTGASTRATKPYPEIIGLRHGMTVANYGISGSTVKSYAESNLSSVLSATENSLYICSWGINDASSGLSVGTTDDINIEDYTQNADTFCGNYGKIISQLLATFTKCRIVIFGTWVYSETNLPYIQAAESVAELFGIPFCNPYDDQFFKSDIWNDQWYSHPTQAAYSGMACAVERIMEKCITTNATYFKFANKEGA